MSSISLFSLLTPSAQELNVFHLQLYTRHLTWNVRSLFMKMGQVYI